MMDSCLSLRLSVLTYLILQGQVLHSATFPQSGQTKIYSNNEAIDGTNPTTEPLILIN